MKHLLVAYPIRTASLLCRFGAPRHGMAELRAARCCVEPLVWFGAWFAVTGHRSCTFVSIHFQRIYVYQMMQLMKSKYNREYSPQESVRRIVFPALSFGRKFSPVIHSFFSRDPQRCSLTESFTEMEIVSFLEENQGSRLREITDCLVRILETWYKLIYCNTQDTDLFIYH